MGLIRKKNSSVGSVGETGGSQSGRRRPLSNSDQAPRGGAPGTMFSYYSQRSRNDQNIGRRDNVEVEASSPVQSAAIQLTRHRILVVIALLTATGLIIYLSSLSAVPHIVLLQNKTTAYFLQSDQVYQQTAEQSLQGSIFNRNKLTLDTTKVRADLLKNYPEIKNVSVDTPLFGRQPQIYIEPYTPSFILTTTSGNAFLLDATGRALATTSQIPDLDTLNVPTLQDKTGSQVTLGARAVPSSTISFTQTIVTALKAKDIISSTLALPAGSYELDVSVAGQPYFIKFNLMDNALQQAGTYLAVQNRLKSERTTPAQYVDVRIPERAYYK